MDRALKLQKERKEKNLRIKKLNEIKLKESEMQA